MQRSASYTLLLFTYFSHNNLYKNLFPYYTLLDKGRTLTN